MAASSRTQPQNPLLKGKSLRSILPTESHVLRSDHIKQSFKVDVMLPARLPGELTQYPVVYITDGNWVFEMCRAISLLLQLSKHDAPPYILVSIGYPSDCPFAGMFLRAREYTFPPYPPFDLSRVTEYIERRLSIDLYDGILLPEKDAKMFHGAEDFRKFLGDELIPFIERTYPVVPGDRTYFGHSGGGFFGLHTLFTQPDLFRNYIVSSPGLLFHGEGPGGIRYEHCDFGAQMVRTFVASNPTLSGQRLYMSAGAEEEFEPALGSWQVVSGFYQV